RFYVPDMQVTSPHNAGAVVTGQDQAISMVTRIFGSQYHPGRLFFDDVWQSQDHIALYNSDNRKDGRYKEIQVGINTQARLDRLTRTAVKGALYTSEFGIRNLCFYGTIAGWLECHKCFTDEESL